MPNSEGLSDRLKSRMKQVRESSLETIIKENKQVLAKVDKSLNELEKAQDSNPILLRLVQEMYAYIQRDGEMLSDVVSDLKIARAAAEVSSEQAKLTVPEIAGTETMIGASWLYYEREPDTVRSFISRVDLPLLQQILEELDRKRWLELMGCIEAARANRK